MSSSDDETRAFRSVNPTNEYSPQLKPHASVIYRCPYCQNSPRQAAKQRGSFPQFSQSQHITIGKTPDTFTGMTHHQNQYRFKQKADFSEFEKKLKRAGKEIERLNRLTADQSLEIEALAFVKQISQFEVDAVIMQENQRLKKDIEDLNAHITVLTQADQQHQSAIDNSETFNTWNDKKDSNRINIDVSNLDIEENIAGETSGVTSQDFEAALIRLEDIRRLIIADCRFNKHATNESSPITLLEEYQRNRSELFTVLQRLSSLQQPQFPQLNQSIFPYTNPMLSPNIDKVAPLLCCN